MTTLLTSALAPWLGLGSELPSSLAVDDYAALAALLLASSAYLSRGKLWARPNRYEHLLYERPQQQPGAAASNKSTRDISELVATASAKIAILWASQSGTAERLATRLHKQIVSSFGTDVLLLDISVVDPQSFTRLPSDTPVVFMASTFGEGDPSDNMHEFWEWQQHLARSSLRNLRYLAFGLGNSNYKHYNHVIKTLCAKIDAAGAVAVMPVGLADDAAGDTEEHYIEWKESLFQYLQNDQHYQRREVVYEPSLRLDFDDSLECVGLHTGLPASNGKASNQSKVFTLPIMHSRELFAETTDRNCLHIDLDLSKHSELKYRTGDHLGLWASNPTTEVERLLRLMGQRASRKRPCLIKSLDGSAIKVPSPTTIDALFENYLEIGAPVSREHVEVLARFSPSDDAKAFLTRISSHKDSYAEYLGSHYVTFGRLLEQACNIAGSWKTLPLSVLIEMLPAMQPRYYSISSSSVVQPRSVSITAVVSDQVVGKTEHRIPGLATNYLLTSHSKDVPHPGHSQAHDVQCASSHDDEQLLQPTWVLHAHVRRSNFKLPVSASTPILMVGSGTGIAPFRAFVQERARLRGMGRDVGFTKLFFGCRHPEQDLIYERELAEHGTQLGDAFSLTTAFSRPSDGTKKRYVQDCLHEEAESTCRTLVDENAYFYICGSAVMARGVSEAVACIIGSRQGWNDDQVQSFIDRQRRQKRWLQDVWG